VNLESANELLGLLVTIVTIVFLLTKRKSATFLGSLTVLSALLLLNLSNYLINFLEWSSVDVPPNSDAIEDTLDLLTPLVWWFLFYSCCQTVTASRLQSILAEREAMEHNVRRSETELRAVLSSVPVSIYSIDRQGTILFVNEKVRDEETRESVGTSVYSKLPPEALEQLKEAINGVFETGTPQTFDVGAPDESAKDDAQVWVSCRLAPVLSEGATNSAILVTTDITERKRIENQLKDSERRFRILVENAPEAILVFDVDEDLITDCNKNALNLFAISEERLRQSSLLDLCPLLQPNQQASAEALYGLVHRALDGEIPVVQWVHRNAEGEDFPCEVRLVRLPAGQRRLIRCSVTVRPDRG
jgi:PAS domain S-box-containing protein